MTCGFSGLTIAPRSCVFKIIKFCLVHHRSCLVHSYKAGYQDRTHYISSTGFFHDKISWYEPNLAWQKVTRRESIIGPFFGLRPNLDEEILRSSKWWRLIQIEYCWCEKYFSHLVIPLQNSWLFQCRFSMVTDAYPDLCF